MTLGARITSTPLDLAASLVDAAGTTTPLAANKLFSVQNTTSIMVFLWQGTTPPSEVNDFWTRIGTREFVTIRADGDPIWARTQYANQVSAVSVNPAD